MEDKNRELNVEEMEQGVGGVYDRSGKAAQRRVATLIQWMKMAKSSGSTKEEFFNYRKYAITPEEKEWLSPKWDSYN